jgi:excisionase family DNA binding protein
MTEAATELHVHYNTIRKMMKTGRLQGTRLGRSIFITENQIREVLNANNPAIADVEKRPVNCLG